MSSTRPSTPFGLSSAFRAAKSAVDAGNKRPGTPVIGGSKAGAKSSITPRNPNLHLNISRKRSRDSAPTATARADHESSNPMNHSSHEAPIEQQSKDATRVVDLPAAMQAHEEIATDTTQYDSARLDTHHHKRLRTAELAVSSFEPEAMPGQSQQQDEMLEYDLPSTNDVFQQYERFKLNMRDTSPEQSEAAFSENIAAPLSFGSDQLDHRHYEQEEEQEHGGFEMSQHEQQQHGSSDQHDTPNVCKPSVDVSVQTDLTAETVETSKLPVEQIYGGSLPYLSQARQHEPDQDETCAKEKWLEKIATAMSRIDSIISRSDQRAETLRQKLATHDGVLNGRTDELTDIRKRIAEWTDSLDLLRIASSFQA